MSKNDTTTSDFKEFVRFDLSSKFDGLNVDSIFNKKDEHLAWKSLEV